MSISTELLLDLPRRVPCYNRCFNERFRAEQIVNTIGKLCLKVIEKGGAHIMCKMFL